MRRASDLYGLPVVDSTTQRKMGAVNEVLIDLPRECLVALVMPGMLLGEPGLIPVEGASIGSEQVKLADREVVTRGDVASRLRQGKITLDRARKLTVITRSGERLGNVEDLILDGCQIVSLELSDGLIQDIFQGRTVLKLPEDVEFEGDHIIVPDDTHCQPSGHKQQSTWHRDQGF